MNTLVLKKTFYLIEVSPPNALVYFHGNRIILTGSFVKSELNCILKILSTPISILEFEKQTQLHLTSSERNELLQTLTHHRMIEVYESSRTDQISTQHNHPVNRLLGPIHHSTQTIQQGISRVESYRVQILSSIPGGVHLATCLSQMGFRDVSLFENQDRDIQIERFKREKPAGNFAEKREHELIVTLTPPHQIQTLRELNKILQPLQKPWLMINQDPFGCTIGPLFFINPLPCYECYIERLFNNTQQPDKTLLIDQYFSAYPHQTSDAAPLISEMTAHVAALEITKFASDLIYTKALRGQYVFDFINHRNEFHSLLPVPHCHVCQPVQTRREYQNSLRGDFGALR